jgi:hypothetical protein
MWHPLYMSAGRVSRQDTGGEVAKLCTMALIQADVAGSESLVETVVQKNHASKLRLLSRIKGASRADGYRDTFDLAVSADDMA